MTEAIDRARAFRLFDEALGRPVESRQGWLEQVCAAEPGLLEAVMELLAAERDAAATLVAPTGPEAEGLEVAAHRTFGRFRVLERIARGGMGSVFRAERTDGLEQRVALKLLPADSLGQPARIEREVRTLARLQHPAVAQLIDAGVEPDGTGWIAMELIDGVPIDRFCAAGPVPLAGRVQLLAEVAEAVAFAHRNFVVHRDIKPGNVLVTPAGQPKLIDFGIAKLLDAGGGSGTTTWEGGLLFTPQYAAPEQLTGGPISAATDVFGLGALGYQLLTGRTLFPDAPSPLGYLVAVARDHIPLPSRAAQESGDRVAARGLEGDLDAILARALEREPTERYPSAADMADDLRRHLGHRPVLARAQTRGYRARRFLRRNAVAVSLSALLVISLVVGAAVAAVQARRATRSRDEARAVTAFLTQDILAAANPLVSGTRDVQLRPLLDQAAGTLQARFAGQPRVLADVQAALGTGYAALFDPQKAEALLSEAERGLTREYGNAAPETQRVRLALWYLYMGLIDLPKLAAVSARMSAAELSAGRPESANALRGRLMGEWIPCFAASPVPIGWSNCGPVVSRYRALAREHFGDDALVTHEMDWLLGVALVYGSQEDRAVDVLRAACAGMERAYGPRHHRLTECRRYLARALDGSGSPAEAEPLFAEAVTNLTATLGPESIFVAVTEYELAGAALHAGHLPLALAAARAAVRDLSRPGCECAENLLRARMRLSLVESVAGPPGRGLADARAVFARAVAQLGPDAPALVGGRAAYAELLASAGALEEALAVASENLAVARRAERRPDWLVAQCEAELAALAARAGRQEDGMALLDRAVPELERTLGPDSVRTRSAKRLREQLGQELADRRQGLQRR